MRCQRCQGAAPGRGTKPSGAHGARILVCESCGSTILILDGVTLTVRDAMLSRLAGFGLALTGDPLLEPGGNGHSSETEH